MPLVDGCGGSATGAPEADDRQPGCESHRGDVGGDAGRSRAVAAVGAGPSGGATGARGPVGSWVT